MLVDLISGSLYHVFAFLYLSLSVIEWFDSPALGQLKLEKENDSSNFSNVFLTLNTESMMKEMSHLVGQTK